MPSPNERSILSNLSEWTAAHRRAVTVGLFGFVALLAVLATVMVVGIFQSPRTGRAPTGSAVPSATASESTAPSPRPTADAGSPTPHPSDPASPSPTDAPVEPPLADGWIEIGSFGSDEGIEAVNDVVEAPFGYLAAGVHINTRAMPVFGPLPQEGRIWLSVDGSSWEDVTPTGTFGDSSVYQLVVLPDGAVVAFAQVSVLAEGDFSTAYAAWETMDGRTWTGAELSAGTAPVSRMAAGGAGYLTTSLGADPGEQLWYASDGRSFTEVMDPTGGRIITAMGAGPEGFVILAEGFESAGPPTAYASANGIDWYEATAGGWDVEQVTPIGPDWVALGRGPLDDEWRDTETASWVSANGIDWAEAGQIPLRALPLPDGFACREFLSEPISTGNLVVISTTLSYPCGEGHVERFGAAHVTADGATWTALPFTTEASPTDDDTRGATVNGGLDLESGTLLVGETNYRATFWFRPND